MTLTRPRGLLCIDGRDALEFIVTCSVLLHRQYQAADRTERTVAQDEGVKRCVCEARQAAVNPLVGAAM